MFMARFLPAHKDMILHGSDIADYIIRRGTHRDLRNGYDIATLADAGTEVAIPDVFAHLARVESESRIIHYRIVLHDEEIIAFLQQHRDIDMLTFLVCVMTHELLHIERITAGQADFHQVDYDEEVRVDNITRLLLAKHPVTGRARVFNLLDKLTPPPLYNHRTISDGGMLDAYL